MGHVAWNNNNNNNKQAVTLHISTWGHVMINAKVCVTLHCRYTTLYGVSYASVYEQTHSRQCCNLLISWLSTQPVIVLPSVSRACDNRSTVHIDWQLGGYSSACVRNVWGINRVLLPISIWFSCQFAGFHERLHVCYYCADVWSVLAHFCSDTVAHVHRQAGQVRSINSACRPDGIVCQNKQETHQEMR